MLMRLSSSDEWLGGLLMLPVRMIGEMRRTL